MIWEEFKRNAPELAASGEERFEGSGLVLLGTLTKDGWPRISPVEPLFTDGQLYLGMMWRSRKALDLLRDPRCTVHNTVSNRDASEGQFKLYGPAVDVRDLEKRRRFGDAFYEKLGLRPEEPEYHLFSVEIERASFSFIKGEEWVHNVWKLP